MDDVRSVGKCVHTVSYLFATRGEHTAERSDRADDSREIAFLESRELRGNIALEQIYLFRVIPPLIRLQKIEVSDRKKEENIIFLSLLYFYLFLL